MRTCYCCRPSLGRRNHLSLPEKTSKPLVDYSLSVIASLLMRSAIDTSLVISNFESCQKGIGVLFVWVNTKQGRNADHFLSAYTSLTGNALIRGLLLDGTRVPSVVAKASKKRSRPLSILNISADCQIFPREFGAIVPNSIGWFIPKLKRYSASCNS